MKTRLLAMVPLLAVTLIGLTPAGACEPIIPMALVLGGAALLGQSVIVLIAAILVKSALYAWFERSHSAATSFGAMLGGNVLSTMVGCFAAAIVAGVPLIGLAGLALCALLPARRIALAYPGINAVFSSFGIVFLMTTLVFASILLWGLARQTLDSHGSLGFYWSLKIAYVFGGLLCGLIITVFWEEWAIWRRFGGGAFDRKRFSSIVAANVITLALVALYAAAVILPRRLASPTFLVELWRSFLPSA
jgi:hypothetical protein